MTDFLVVRAGKKAQNVFDKGRSEAYPPYAGALIKVIRADEHIVRSDRNALRRTPPVKGKSGRRRHSFEHGDALIALC